MSKHDKNRRHTLNQALDAIEVTHLSREAACRKGSILRMPDGQRMFWQTRRPTPEEREAAKANLRPYVECGGESPGITDAALLAILLDRYYAIPNPDLQAGPLLVAQFQRGPRDAEGSTRVFRPVHTGAEKTRW